MNRRDLLIFSGAALATQQAHGQTQPANAFGTATAETAKILLKYGRIKAGYKVPKKETKVEKYIGSLSAALGLTIPQQKAATEIFLNAVTARKSIMSQLKTARKSLSDAVVANDAVAINQASSAIGTLEMQRVTAGAGAHVAFYQLLMPDQQSRVLQYRR